MKDTGVQIAIICRTWWLDFIFIFLFLTYK